MPSRIARKGNVGHTLLSFLKNTRAYPSRGNAPHGTKPATNVKNLTGIKVTTNSKPLGPPRLTLHQSAVYRFDAGVQLCNAPIFRRAQKKIELGATDHRRTQLVSPRDVFSAGPTPSIPEVSPRLSSVSSRPFLFQRRKLCQNHERR